MNLGRLRELAGFVPPGPWRAGRSPFDGQLMLYDADGEAIAHVYAGHDAAEYLAAASPPVLDVVDEGPT